MTTDADLRYDVSDRIAEISLARPPVNALSLSLLEQLIAAFRRAAADDNVRAVVLTSAVPRRFSAGLDLDMLLGKSGAEVRRFLDKLYVELADVQYNLGKPSIAAVGGAARGGGMTLAISCDVLVAGESATFGYPEIDLGLVPAIHFVHLPRIVGRHRAFELLVLRALLWSRRGGFARPRQPGRAGREAAGGSAGNGRYLCDQVADHDAAGTRRLHACERSRLPARRRQRRGAFLQRRHDRRRSGRTAGVHRKAGAELVATSRPPQSSLAPEAFTMAVHLGISALM